MLWAVSSEVLKEEEVCVQVVCLVLAWIVEKDTTLAWFYSGVGHNSGLVL